MYLLTIKDGLGTRHIGPYPSPKHASDDLDRVLETCSERARWQIHALETPERHGPTPVSYTHLTLPTKASV